MNVSTCLNILREIKDVAFATVDENNQPQVRIIVHLLQDKRLLKYNDSHLDKHNSLMNYV